MISGILLATDVAQHLGLTISTLTWHAPICHIPARVQVVVTPESFRAAFPDVAWSASKFTPGLITAEIEIDGVRFDSIAGRGELPGVVLA